MMQQHPYESDIVFELCAFSGWVALLVDLPFFLFILFLKETKFLHLRLQGNKSLEKDERRREKREMGQLFTHDDEISE